MVTESRTTELAVQRSMRAHPAGRARARRPEPVRGSAPAEPPLRLTARGRRVVWGVVLVAGMGLAAAVDAGVAAGGRDGSGAGELRLAGERSVVVRPGETLWSIAGPLAGSEDIRSVVWRIRELNGLPGADLVPGQILRLP